MKFYETSLRKSKEYAAEILLLKQDIKDGNNQISIRDQQIKDQADKLRLKDAFIEAEGRRSAEWEKVAENEKKRARRWKFGCIAVSVSAVGAITYFAVPHIYK